LNYGFFIPLSFAQNALEMSQQLLCVMLNFTIT
jgi:hypothetical protein